jgi:phospho-N-acetylmuramoyl-pentapeptide-transferase
MLYNLLEPYFEVSPFFNLFRYISFRSGCAIFTALIISFIIGPRLIKYLQGKSGQPIREDGPKSHLKTKQGTPTMGGIMIISSFLLSVFLWSDLTNQYVWVVAFVTLGYFFIGFYDDYLKVTKKTPKGVRGKNKLLLQTFFALITVVWYSSLQAKELQFEVYFPVFKDLIINLGWFYIPFGVFVLIGSSNAVNLTDGLDGLAIVPVMIVAGSFAFISYVVGNVVFSEYLYLPFINGAGELTIVCSAIVGSALGFLWYNAPPAKIFMGDTGSLSLGAALATISLITKNEFVLAIIGGLFVMEALSVIIQVYSFKLTGKRVFRMAPIHHHFEQKGWAESTIVVRFWIITILLAIIGLSTLKLR